MQRRNKVFSGCRKFFSILFFLIFVWLLINTRYEVLSITNYPVNAFLQIDSLVILLSAIAGRTFESLPILAGSVLIITTLFFGRYFCSWICPLGLLNQIASRLKPPKYKEKYSKTQNFKYYFLLFIIILAILGFNAGGVFDPISIIIRSFTVVIIPGFAFIYNIILDLVYNTEAIQFAYDPLKTVYDYILGEGSYNFNYITATGIIFLAIILLNLYKRRFWCNTICPLGALSGLIAKFSLFKITQDKEKCTGCKQCAANCPGNAQPHLQGELKHSECMVCGNCIDKCPIKGLTYKYNQHLIAPARFDPDRRALLVTSAAAIAAIPLLNLKSQANESKLLRPPGAHDMELFLDKCIRCGECVRVCPNNALQFALYESGFNGIYSPVFIPQIGYCEYSCNLCSIVCPTGAIRPITLEEKQAYSIGKAEINKNLCIPYAENKYCIVCEEHCPVPGKAIDIIDIDKIGKPIINKEKCIGCGICEFKCPVRPERAIKVNSE